jgi:hypothetical protein
MSAQSIPLASQIGELFGFPIPSLFVENLYFTEYLYSDSNFSTLWNITSSTYYPGALMGSGQEFVERIEARLLESELRADTVQDREQYQLARRVLRRAYFDNCTNAYTLAYAWMYGSTPDVMTYKRQAYEAFHLKGEVWPSYRYSWQYKAAQAKSALPPKKHSSSVRIPTAKKVTA